VRIRVDVIIEKDQDGYYAYCPALEGCQSEGESFEEACENIREAAELYWETLSAEERAELLGTMVIATSVEVHVA